MNICHFLGYIAESPTCENVTKADGSSTYVTHFRLGIVRRFRRNDGELGKQTNYIDCEAWDSGGEMIFKNFKRGDNIILHCSVRSVRDEGGDHVVFRVQQFEFPFYRDKEIKSE